MSENSSRGVSLDGDKNPQKLPRREFLRALAMLPVAVSTARNIEPKSETPVNDLEVLPVREIGNLSLQVVLTKHHERYWQTDGEQITQLIKDNDLIIPEYFPLEYRDLEEKYPLLLESGYKEANGLFNHVVEVAWKERKEMWVVDPAYSEAAIMFRVQQNIPLAGGLSMGIDSLIFANQQLIKKASLEKPLDKTEELIIKAASILLYGASTGLGAVGSVGDKNPMDPTERKFRRLMVAAALDRLGQILPLKTKALLIYPRSHWQSKEAADKTPDNIQLPGIENYLNDPDLRNKELETFLRKFGNKRIYADLFKSRHYTPGYADWIRQEGFTLEK